MGAAYDSYDYSAYWEGRDYEHNSEVVALKRFLSKIPKINTIIEIGAGFGRLTPLYAYRSKKIILTDPSARLLGQARKNLADLQNVHFLQSGIEKLSENLPKSQADLVVLVRVAHHFPDLETTFQTVNALLRPGGYFILEYANKIHFKAVVKQIFHGNFNFPSDLSPSDQRSAKSIHKHTIPFLNHHPAFVSYALNKAGFRQIEKLSVSNFRSPFLKTYMPLEVLLSLESFFQKPLNYINFGPSVFILAQKKENP